MLRKFFPSFLFSLTLICFSGAPSAFPALFSDSFRLLPLTADDRPDESETGTEDSSETREKEKEDIIEFFYAIPAVSGACHVGLILNTSPDFRALSDLIKKNLWNPHKHWKVTLDLGDAA